MVSLGKVLIMPRDAYEENATYAQLDIVTHNGVVWMCKQTAIGIEPTDDSHDHWMKLFGYNIVNNLTHAEAGGVLDARQGATLKNYVDEKVVFEVVSVTSNNNGVVGIPVKDSYDVYSVMCKSDGCTLVGNVNGWYLHALDSGNVGDLLPNQLCVASVIYVKKEQVM